MLGSVYRSHPHGRNRSFDSSSCRRYTACFVSDPTDASIWGSYGNGHRGVCLKFNATASTNGKPTLKLRQIFGWNGSPVYGDVAHEFQQVEYSSQFVEVNFYRSLGRLT